MSVYTYATLDNASEASTTQPLGINDAGQVVGIFDLPIIFSTYYGFLYSGGSYTTLNDPSSTAPNGSGTFAYSINAFGQIVGYYRGRTGMAAYSLGQVGTDWGFVTLGGFFGNDTADMLLRNSNTGGFQVYDITNDITGSAFLGNVGLNWQVMGFGNFSSLGENDMILRNSGTGGM